MNIRTIAFLAGVMVLAFALRAQSQSNINLLPNPGFENIKDGWADIWWKHYVPESGTITLDQQEKHSGTNSLHIAFNPAAGPKAGNYIMVAQGSLPNFRPGSTYTYSAYVKTKGLAGRAYLEALQYPAPIPPECSHSSQVLQGTSDWTRISLTFTARKDIDTVQFRCSALSVSGKLQGEAWFDDCKVEEGKTPTDYMDAWKTDFYIFGTKSFFFPVPFDFQASNNYVTPHVAPSVTPKAPKIPVLFALYWENLREAVELAQRAEIQTRTVAINAALRFKNNIHEECAARLAEELKQNPKVLVMDPDTWELLVSEDRAAIEQRVRQGMGLVLYDLAGAPGKQAQALLAKGTLRPGYPQEPAPFLQVYQFDLGVVVVFYGREVPQNTFMREWRYDRAVRAIYAAAQRPAGRLTLGTTPAVLPAGQPWKLRAALTNAKESAAATLQARVYPTAPGSRLTLATVAIPVLQERTVPFEGQAELEWSGLPAGLYFIEAFAMDKDKKVVAWELFPVVADGPVRIWTAIASDRVLRRGAGSEIKVVLENNSPGDQAVRLAASLTDTENRLLAMIEPLSISLPPGRTEKSIRIAAAHSATPAARLALDLESSGIRLDHRELVLSTEPLVQNTDFRFAYYSEPFTLGCADLGSDTIVAGAGSGAMELGLRAYPWFSYMPGGKGDPVYPFEKGDSVTSPKTIAKAGKCLSEELGKLLPFRSVAVMLHDEWTHDFEPRPEHLAYFKEFLRKSYGNIAVLNRSWDTNLKSFDEVSFELCTEAGVRDKGVSPVPWADLQTAMEHAVADYISSLYQAASAVDPDVRLGLSGTQEPTATNGLDWWLLMQACRSMATYDGIHTFMEEAFQQKGTGIFQWSYPTGGQVGRARHDPWRDLFRQREGYLHYGGGFANMFRPDYQPYPVALEIADQIEQMRRGPARLIRGAKREYFGVAMLFSMPSLHASRLPALRKTGPDYMNDILYSTMRAVTDARLDAKFVSYEQLAKGQVTTKDYRVLMLPYAQALSAAEVNAIRQFAKSGGVVIADVRPGIYDEHCKKLPTGSLDDMFGIGSVGAGLAMVAGSLQPGTNYGPLPQAAVLMGESNLCPAGAVAFGQVVAKDKTAPALLVNQVGKGKAILFNFAFPDYRKYKAGGVGGEVGIETQSNAVFGIRDLLGKLLEKEAQIAPFARLLAPDNTEMRGVRMFVYRDDPATYIGLLPEYTWVEETKPIVDGKLALAQPGELYDVRRGEYLGKTGSAIIKVQETYAKLYAVLPYRVEALELKAPRATQVGKGISFTVRLKVAGGRPGRHVIVARLQRPDGTERRWDRMTFDAPGGAGEWVIPLALNDPTGDWKLIVQDAASGIRSEAIVRVEAAR